MKKDEKTIIIKNATEHNLKSLNVEIPHHRITVVTGVSGSGKSSLVFDTIFREGQRRYLESFSSYARRFLGKMSRPAVGHIAGLSPCIAVDQKSVVRNPRSTVGTMTGLYDYLRLLFARLGKPGPGFENIKLDRSLFSFNSSRGACPDCKGLGVQDQVEPDLLIGDPTKTLRQGALVITTGSGYIIYSQVTMDVLDKVCRSHGFDVDIPWEQLTPEQQEVVLYGSDKIKIPYGKHPLESRLKWSGITAKPREEGYYKGIVPVIANILRVDRNKNILRFARSKECQSCRGTRLSPEALSVTFQGLGIGELAAMAIEELERFFANLEISSQEAPVLQSVTVELGERAGIIKKLGLGYLTLDRESTSLSGGEAQRLRLCNQLGTGLRGILYILDEPSIGLHPLDNDRMLDVMRSLRDNGNTLLVVEHDEDTVLAADHVIDIGPGAGIMGGHILYQGTPTGLISGSLTASVLEESRTVRFIRGIDGIAIPEQRRPGNGVNLNILGAAAHNLASIDVTFKLGTLNVVTGVSGAGKSTLVHLVLARRLKSELLGSRLEPGQHKDMEGIDHIDKVIEIDQSPIGRTPRSNPATYTKLFDDIRDLFAGQPAALEKGWGKGRFSFNVTGGRCESCQGAGLQQIGMHFLGDVDVVCEECGGKRFNRETLEIRYRSKNIFDVLEMQVGEAVEFFKDHKKIHRRLQGLNDLGLGYIALGQSATTLSGGEAQRVKLASELSRPVTGKTLYILDEPTTGLHAADIKMLLDSLNSLVEQGNTVITVEHHPDFIKSADWVIDLGPGSGSMGGRLTAMGTPEQVAQCQQSHTGEFLRRLFAGEMGQTSAADRVVPVDPMQPICLRGVTTHNLQHIDVDIPVNKITVVTGVSGSGKSSLAFDTLFAEGQKRFLGTFSSFARRFLTGTGQADMESCSGLQPTIAVSRFTAARTPRSTVGTMTDIYDYYRLLYARAGTAHCPHCEKTLLDGQCDDCGFQGEKILYASMFSFNHHQGSCPRCKGLGAITVCDVEKLVSHPHLSLLSGAIGGSKTGRFYGDPHGQYVSILQAVGLEMGVDFSLPWNDLSLREKEIAMNGTGEKVYTVTWNYKRKSRIGEHLFEAVWSGFANYVNQEYQRKHADKRGDSMLLLMKDDVCPSCGGDRLKAEFRSVFFNGLSIALLCKKSIIESIQYFKQLETPGKTMVSPRNLEVSRELRKEILRRLGFLRDGGLGYLSLSRSSSSLSGGEAQRIRLSAQLGAGLTGVTYVLDEPTTGLHSRDTERLLTMMRELTGLGNTLVVVEHDEDVIRAADYILDLGPGAGREGGRVVARGTPAQLLKDPFSKTGRYLARENLSKRLTKRRSQAPGIQIKNAWANNLQGISLEIPGKNLVALTGVSGSGKSSLVFDVLAESVASGHAQGCESILGLDSFAGIVTLEQEGISGNQVSNSATYTGIFDKIREIFAQSAEAVGRGYKKSHFSMNTKGGRCEACRGLGRIRTSMDFLSDIWAICEECGGRRYSPETLECTVNGKTIAHVLEMTVAEGLVFFKESGFISRALGLMNRVGLEYLLLGQTTNTLSAGEAQRLKLVTELLKGKGGNNLYLFDEPTRGLHFEDVERLLMLFKELVDAGHSILVIEHHPAVICAADWVIDLGPDGGDDGGQIMGMGMPEDIAALDSPTGRVLQHHISR